MGSTRDHAVARLTAPGMAFELVPIEVQGVPWRVYRNAETSLRDVLLATEAYGDREFLVYEHERITYAEHLRLVRGIARHLTEECGVRQGDRVAIGMRNHPEWIAAFWATVALGAISVPLNAWWTGPELAYALRDSGSRVAILDGERFERLEPLLGEGLDLAEVIVTRPRGALPDGVLTWTGLLARFRDDDALPAVEIRPEDHATIMYTSGTTGEPKGAVQTHRNHCTNLMNMRFMGALTAELNGVSTAAAAPQGVSLQAFPYFHIGGMSGFLMATAAGSKIVMMYKWDLEQAIDLIVRERVTATSLVMMLLRQVLDSPRLPEVIAVGSLTGLSSGGAPVPPDLIRKLDDEFAGRVSPANGYGLTETTSAVVMNFGADYVAHPDSIGRPQPVADVRFVDESETVVPDGEVGELCARGPNIVDGYWNKPEATALAFVDGWFHTGDLGFRDEDGLLHVVDRLKDVIIQGGENVYSAEVEAIMHEHPAVADVAIVGLPDPTYGEQVVAVVRFRDDSTATQGELQEFVAGRLARFKVPAQVIVFDEPIPRNATGKVMKRDLRRALLPAADSTSPISNPI